MPPTSINLLQKGGEIFHRIRTYYRPEVTAEPQPPISERTAFLCAIVFTAFYVAPFYLSPTLCTTAVTNRDAPAVIRARVRAVGLTCMACSVLAVYILAVCGHGSPGEVLRWTGIWPSNPFDVLRVLLLVMVLLVGSLYESLIVDVDWRHWSAEAFKEAVWGSWAGYRNLIVAPASEEFVFRALTIPLFLLAEMSPVRIVFLSPLAFGLAHLHHFVGFLQARTPADQRLPPASVFLQGLVISLFQFAYTSLFGFFATFVFLRTGNLWAIIFAHSFCNHMGLPRLWGRVGQYVQHESSPTQKQPESANNIRGDGGLHDGSSVADGDLLRREVENDGLPQNLGVGWTIVYYVLVIAGCYGFYTLLFPLTKSRYALAAL